MNNKRLGVTIALLSVAMFIAAIYGVVNLVSETYRDMQFGVYDPHGQWILWGFMALALITSVLGFIGAYEIGRTKRSKGE
ncbi:MAG: hypothetical protein UW68_C0017G0023 [Candidatus Collierbacteria bacterium GW2011_GWB1_44_6]|uniref:Uncharacterized protein n=2 Tax=Candidatus Collieribacteriota TaxID=1752725 RepID=A0A0G1JP44_9BACT|nr:MAG: hypothetical protein UV68_C0016G0005 [Candidatus Collierbacteria bacterium GW2011_GWC2_43_12]KKT73088.1 MAG: hypothetical protein UW68_C0017G0023 [Candidatus Collierbacteria bacterium GW2011_GWB1_44_6]